jgi:KDO2-lipid IV(A) lauroyltransferase
MESDIEKNKKEFIQRQVHLSDEDIKKTSYDFSLFQSNIQRFLPKWEIDNFEELYKQFLYSQYLVSTDQNDFNKLNALSVINHSAFDLNPLKLKDPTIFATFHYGSYRVINTYLLTRGFKVVLILDALMYMQQKAMIEEVFLNYKEEVKKNNSDFIVLNVKDISIIPQLQKLLLDGYVLVVYMDGNSGYLNNKNFNKGYLEIDFLNSKMYVKTGIPVLSLLLKASIIPVMAYWREHEELEMKFYPSISSNHYTDSKLYVKDSLKAIFSILEKDLSTNPAPWVCWTYMHKWFERNEYFPYEAVDRKNLKYEFNRTRYTLFFLQNQYYLFDKFSYQAFPIDEILHNILKNNYIDKVKSSILEDLISRNVIV